MGNRRGRRGLTPGLLAVVAAVMLLVGCGAPQATTVTDDRVEAAASAVEDLGPEVAPEVVAELNAQDAITVVDVREDWEYDEGHIEGAQLIPLGTLRDRVDEIPTDQPVVLVCRSGNRSGQAFRFLQQQGFDNVHNMTGGMLAWEGAGLEIEK